MMSEIVTSTENPVNRWRRFVRFFLRSRPAFWRTLGCLGGIIIPLICLSLGMQSGSPFLLSKWQSGLPNQYASLMLKAPSVLPFYPFLLFNMVCCGLALFGGKRWIDRIWVRFGIYTGVLLAIQFHLLLFAPTGWHIVYIAVSVLTLFLGVAITFGVVVIIMSFFTVMGKLKRKVGGRAFAIGWLMVFVIRCVIVLKENGWHIAHIFFPYEVFGAAGACLVMSTVLATSTYGLLSWYVWCRADGRRIRFGMLQMFGGLTWTGVYLAAWRASVEMALAEYKTLPISEPKCYVCTAAARGHGRFVGSFEVASANGTPIVVNRQLQILKAAELAVMVTLPKLHRCFRWFYDRVGPRMAACLATRWIADIAFLSLKSIEWPAKCFIKFAGVDDEQINRLYQK